MGADERDKDLAYRVGSVATSSAAGTVYTLVGLLLTVFGGLSHTGQLAKVLLGVETVLLIGMVGSQAWLRRAYLRLRRANAKAMSDPGFFERMRSQFERDLTAGYEDIADGRLRVFATEVVRVSVQLLRTLTNSPGSIKVVRATDLTTNPHILASRSEYLSENRRFVTSGGVIKRLFIVRRQDLLSAEFAAALLELIAQHRSIGVQCGIAVRDRLRPDQAVDFVLFGTGAVLIEEEQGDADYTSGRSSIDFKGVARWIATFDELWPVDGVPTPVVRLQQYEATARELLQGEAWDAVRVGKALDSVD